MSLVFDDAALIETAKAVQAVNPSARSFTLDGLAQSMKNNANRVFLDDPGGYFSTLGYVLTSYYDSEKRHCIYSSVMSYSVLQHVEGRQ